METDLTVLSPAMLDGTFNRLLVEYAAAKDACDHQAEHDLHLALLDVIAEYASRTDAWIAEHV
jgi:hypothetical protein